jgi:hypothetical protein
MPVELWAHIADLEERQKQDCQVIEALQKINRDLAAHIQNAEAREKDHRRRFIELAACYAMPHMMVKLTDTGLAAKAASQGAFCLSDVLRDRFAAEIQKGHDDHATT